MSTTWQLVVLLGAFGLLPAFDDRASALRAYRQVVAWLRWRAMAGSLAPIPSFSAAHGGPSHPQREAGALWPKTASSERT
ncbi:MAG: hypothetical protein ACRDTT_18895 [Pseudonocardiaceae bacterium]